MSDHPMAMPEDIKAYADASDGPVEATLTYSEVENMINQMELDFKSRSLALQIARSLYDAGKLPTADELLADAKKIEAYLRTGK